MNYIMPSGLDKYISQRDEIVLSDLEWVQPMLTLCGCRSYRIACITGLPCMRHCSINSWSSYTTIPLEYAIKLAHLAY